MPRSEGLLALRRHQEHQVLEGPLRRSLIHRAGHKRSRASPREHLPSGRFRVTGCLRYSWVLLGTSLED
jgi:hypothetical protein